MELGGAVVASGEGIGWGDEWWVGSSVVGGRLNMKRRVVCHPCMW